MNGFDTAALLVTIAAAAGWLNYRLLKLPQTSGTLLVALLTSLLMMGVDALEPAWGLRGAAADLMANVDLNRILIGGMLSFLLFAGALHLDLDDLIRHRWMIASLATIGVVLSTAIVGLLSWIVFGWLGARAPLSMWLVFGALISPTDPIAVIGLLKELKAPRALEAQIGGESLFNDGVAVVLFFALSSLVGLTADGDSSGNGSVLGILRFFVVEVGGGIVLGLAVGWIGFVAMRAVDDHPLELLITLAIVMSGYAIALRLHVSGPIAVVASGLLIGNHGRRFAMSARTRDHLDAFWEMFDAVLNSILFLLIGLVVVALPVGWHGLAVAAAAIPISLVARAVSIAPPLAAIRATQRVPGLLPILTWSGLRGGLSVAMALSLPSVPMRGLIVVATYGVVTFSILAQGLTMRRLLRRYGIGSGPGA